jgi:hypothetical protein
MTIRMDEGGNDKLFFRKNLSPLASNPYPIMSLGEIFLG